MNKYVALLGQVGPAQDGGAMALLRELLVSETLDVEELIRRQAEIEAAEAALDELAERGREAVRRCLALQAVPDKTNVPLGF